MLLINLKWGRVNGPKLKQTKMKSNRNKNKILNKSVFVMFGQVRLGEDTFEELEGSFVE